MYIKLEKGLYLIGSGLYGLSNWKDCSVYLISDGEESALVDAGAGMDDDTLYKNFQLLSCFYTVFSIAPG